MTRDSDYFVAGSEGAETGDTFAGELHEGGETALEPVENC